MTNSRQSWLDMAKGIGIMLVVFGHMLRGLNSSGLVPTGPAFLLADSVLYSFHMPLFFFLSGILFQASLDRRGRLGSIANRIDTIVYPYILWSIIQGLVEVVLSKYTNYNTTLASVASLLWQPRAQFWFLYVMFLVSVVGALVYYRRSPVAVWVAIAVGALIYLSSDPIPGSPIWPNFARHFVYFALGVAVGNPERISSFFNRTSVLVTSIVAFVAFEYYLHAISGWNYRQGGVQGILVAMVGITAICAIALRLSKLSWSWIALIGMNSMAIYIIHILVVAGVRIALSKFLHVQNIPIHMLTGVLLGIMIPLSFSLFLDRHRIGFVFSLPANWRYSATRILARFRIQA